MNKSVKMLNWRSRLNVITPADHRIGDELLLIDDCDYMRGADYLEPFRCDAVTAIFYTRGVVECSINMQHYRIEAPSMAILLGDSVVHPLSISEDLQARAIVMSSSFADGMMDDVSHSQHLYFQVRENPVIPLDEGDDSMEHFYNLLLGVVQRSSSPFLLEAAHHMMLSMFYSYSHSKHRESTKPISRKGQLYARFLELVRQHFRQARDITFYAEKLGLTPKYLSRVVRDECGRSASEVIDNFVITESKIMLKSTDLTIQQIAYDLNFAGQSHFGKYFRRVAGMSPTEYRSNQ